MQIPNLAIIKQHRMAEIIVKHTVWDQKTKDKYFLESRILCLVKRQMQMDY